MKNLFLKNSGIVMTEALMAVSLMASAVIITGSIIETTVSTTKQTRDYAIAQNLLDEASSAVENIINSNKILYPGDDKCWLTLNTDPCSESNVIKESVNYVPSLKDGRWFLEQITANALNLKNGEANNEVYRLYKKENRIGEDIFPLYTHENDKTYEVSPYFRSIQFSGINVSDISLLTSVEWMDRSVVRRVSDTVSLFRD